MSMEELVRLVTAEVMRHLKQDGEEKAGKYKILALLTGGMIGLEAGMKSLQKLKNLSMEFAVLLSPSAERIIGSKRVEEFWGRMFASLIQKSVS